MSKETCIVPSCSSPRASGRLCSTHRAAEVHLIKDARGAFILYRSEDADVAEGGGMTR